MHQPSVPTLRTYATCIMERRKNQRQFLFIFFFFCLRPLGKVTPHKPRHVLNHRIACGPTSLYLFPTIFLLQCSAGLDGIVFRDASPCLDFILVTALRCKFGNICLKFDFDCMGTECRDFTVVFHRVEFILYQT